MDYNSLRVQRLLKTTCDNWTSHGEREPNSGRQVDTCSHSTLSMQPILVCHYVQASRPFLPKLLWPLSQPCLGGTKQGASQFDDRVWFLWNRGLVVLLPFVAAATECHRIPADGKKQRQHMCIVETQVSRKIRWNIFRLPHHGFVPRSLFAHFVVLLLWATVFKRTGRLADGQGFG